MPSEKKAKQKKSIFVAIYNNNNNNNIKEEENIEHNIFVKRESKPPQSSYHRFNLRMIH